MWNKMVFPLCGSPLISFHGNSSALTLLAAMELGGPGQKASQSATGLSDFRPLLFPPIAPRRRHVNLLSRTQLKLNLSRLSLYIYIYIDSFSCDSVAVAGHKASTCKLFKGQ